MDRRTGEALEAVGRLLSFRALCRVERAATSQLLTESPFGHKLSTTTQLCGVSSGGTFFVCPTGVEKELFFSTTRIQMLQVTLWRAVGHSVFHPRERSP